MRKWCILIAMVMLVISMPKITLAKGEEKNQELSSETQETDKTEDERLEEDTFETAINEYQSEVGEYQNKISNIRNEYCKNLKDGKISKNLFIVVNTFLGNTEYFLTTDSSEKYCEDFSDDYIATLYKFHNWALENLENLVGYLNNEDILKDCINGYNADMQYIQNELSLYGIQENLQVIRADLPVIEQEEKEEFLGAIDYAEWCRIESEKDPRPFALKECEREMDMIKNIYRKALKRGEISQELLIYVSDYFSIKREILTPENCVDEYNAFPDEYIDVLYMYQHDAMEDLAEIIWYVSEDLDAVTNFINQYNSDMDFIEKELQIYGIEENFKASESDFPILFAKG